MARINTTEAFASVQASVSSIALTLATFGFTSDEIQQAERAYIFVNSNSIRVWWDGTAPTVSNGILVEVGIEVLGDNIRNLQLIRNGGIDSEVAIVLES